MDTKPELDGTSAFAEADQGYGRNDKWSSHLSNKSQGVMPALRQAEISPAPPSELSAAADVVTIRSHPTSMTTQITEYPSHERGGQLYSNTSGEERLSTAAGMPEYVENMSPHYPQAYTAPISTDEARAARLAELELSQRNLEDRLARMRYMSAIEEEYERTQAEIERLRIIQA